MKKEMPVPGDPDRTIDGLLKRMLAGTLAVPTPACVAAEALAAWAAGALTQAEAASIEAHLAACARCQTMAAVFARVEPVTVAVPFWRKPASWLIPIAGLAAAAAILWAVLPRRVSVPAPTIDAKVESPIAPIPAAPSPRPETRPVQAVPRPLARTEPRPSLSSRAASPVPPAVGEPGRAAAASAQATAAARPTAPAPAMSQPVSQPPAPAPVFRSMADAAKAGTATGAAPAGDVAPATAVVEVVESPPGAGSFASGGAGGAGGGGRGGGGRGARGGGIATFRAPAPPRSLARWRILSGGGVERSLNAGASWEAAFVDAPATLTGGTASSSTACWLIGRGGAIVRAIDGLHFQRVPFPEPVDLTSIQSAGPAQATVTTADGRVFVTVDAGQTWRRQTN